MVYQAARNAHPERWSGAKRNWDWISQVQLNPDRDLPISQDEERLAAELSILLAIYHLSFAFFFVSFNLGGE